KREPPKSIAPARSLRSTVPLSDRLDLEPTHIPPELPGDLTVSPSPGFEPTVALRPIPGPSAHGEEPHGTGMWMGLAAMGTLVGGGLGAVTLVVLISLFYLGSSLLDPGFGAPNLPLGIAPPTALPRLTVDLLPRPDELVTPDFAPTPVVGGQLADDLPLPPGADPTRDVTFSSVPIGADVYLDGRLVGQTPLVGFPLSEGDHQVKMITDAETLIRGIAVGRRKPGRYVWKGGDLWETHP
ncbi:MAG: PEGA domain-containing protein, partial [Myxococcota bacterium]